MPLRTDVAIVGAGVVGLAIAAEVALPAKDVYVFEKNHTFGLETSSRNSQVIHAGIHYPPGSLKAKLCVEGRTMLYEICERQGLAFKKLGKVIVATSEEEVRELERLHERGQRNGVEDLQLLSRSDLKRLEPNVAGLAALLSPSTGILDAHALTRFFYQRSRERGVKVIFNAEVTGIEQAGAEYRMQIREEQGVSTLSAPVVINSAGLSSDRVAQLAGIDISGAGYRLHYCKGEYFGVDSSKRNLVSRLIYPVPEQAGLGIHALFDVEGKMRLGPSIRYTDEIDYGVDMARKSVFYQAVRGFLPFLEPDDLEPDFAGIRPKLQGPGEDFRDFVIAHEQERGLPGLIDLIGIESPGLTSSPAIARHVGQMVREFLG